MNSETVANRLRGAGLRPTRQRLALAEFCSARATAMSRAEELHAEAVAARVPVSLATVYNTLNQFTGAGLLREVAIEGDRTYFDTNTSNHFHYYHRARGPPVRHRVPATSTINGSARAAARHRSRPHRCDRQAASAATLKSIVDLSPG